MVAGQCQKSDAHKDICIYYQSGKWRRILDIALPGADDTQKDEEGRLFVPAFPGMLCHCHKCMPEKSGCKDKTLRCDRGTDFSGRNPERFFLSVRTYGSFLCICGCAVSDITEKIWHTASYSGIPHRIFQNVCGSPLPVPRAWRAVSRQSDRSCGVLGRNKESKGLGK